MRRAGLIAIATSCLVLGSAQWTGAWALDGGEAPSEVVTEQPEATASGVAFRGELNPGGLPTTYYFDYKSVTCDESPSSCVKQTAVAGPLTGDTEQEVPAVEVVGLTAGRKYSYQLIGNNADGTEAGASVIFTAGAHAYSPPSEVMTEQPEATATGMAFRGELNPGGLPTTYYFEYSSLTCDELPTCEKQTAVAGPLTGDAEQEVPVAEVAGLTAGRKYSYRLVADNADGSEAGASVIFEARPEEQEPPPEEQEPPPNEQSAPSVQESGSEAATPAQSTLPAGPLAVPAVSQSLLPLPLHTNPTGPLTNAQKLTRALRECQRQPRTRRAACARRVRKKYDTSEGKRASRTRG